MTNCNQISLEALRLKNTFDKCYNLKAIDLRDIVELIESVNACASGSFNLKTINGISLFGSGNINITSTSDGTETKIQQGQGIIVSGTGSVANPYIINSTAVAVDGSETKINPGSNINVAGSGTALNPYVINAQIPAQEQQVNADWASISGLSKILNKPQIPQAQVNSDWNSTYGPSMILNKPSSITTNLNYIPSETGGELTSSNGTGASIPLVSDVNAGLISPQTIQELKSNLDNIKIEIVIPSPTNKTNLDFANAINGLNAFSISINQIPTFKAIEVNEEETTAFYVELLGKGAGNYGFGGYKLTSNDVKVTSFKLSSNSITEDPSTQIIDLGENPQDVVTAINSEIPSIPIQESAEGYVIIKGNFSDGTYKEYLWVGAGGIYGAETGASKAVISDLVELNKNSILKATSTSSGTVKTSLTVLDPVVYLKESVDSLLTNKQEKLISGNNIKTINGNSLLGSGNVNVITDISSKENTSNKQNSLTPDGTGVKFPTIDAVNVGLSTKQANITGLNADNLPKWDGTKLIDSGFKVNSSGNVILPTNVNDFAIFLMKDDVPTGSMLLQAGGGSSSFGGGIRMFGSNSSLNAGGVSIGLASGASRKFSINDTGLSNGTDVFNVFSNGTTLINTTTDNTQGKLQVNGNITASAATLSNQVVVKSQLDLKTNGSGTMNFIPKFTGSNTFGDSSLKEDDTFIKSTKNLILNNSNYLILGNENTGINYALGYEDSGDQLVFRNGRNGQIDLGINSLTKNTFINTTDNGIDKLQVGGTISASPATLNNQVTTLGQVNAGLVAKQNTITGTTNVIPKFGIGGLVGSSLSDDGDIVSISGSNKKISVFNAGGSNYGLNLESTTANLFEAISIKGGPTLTASQTALIGQRDNGELFIFNQADAPISFNTNGTQRMQISAPGDLLVNTDVNNGQGKLQVNGNITANPGTLSNQVVVKSQLDLKANLASPSLTGTPTAPTATAGANTTQIATTAFVLANAQSIPQLESNATDLTVWNNGKGNNATNLSYGEFALMTRTTGSSNTAIGNSALRANTSGTNNTAVGYNALLSSNTFDGLTAIGNQALSSNIGYYSTAVGDASLSNNTNGWRNTAIGYRSGNSYGTSLAVTRADGSVFIGSDSSPLGNNESNQIVIGESAKGAGSNTATLGNASITQTILRGTVSAGNGTALNHLVTKAQTLYTNQSISANKTVVIGDFVNNNELILRVDATSGNITITLPTFTALQGYKVTVRKIDSSANSVLIQSVGGVNIDDASTLVVTGKNGKATVGADLVQYIIL